MLHPERLDQPLRWRKPRMVFVNSMSDLFHEQVPDDFIARVFAVMARAREHCFQVLTKRPERMKKLLGGAWLPSQAEEYMACDYDGDHLSIAWPLPNVMLGVSIENRRFVHRADILRETPAAVRFISAEPLIGPLLLADWPERDTAPTLARKRDGWQPFWEDGYQGPELDLTGIDWLIAGGESGSHHRPMRIEWMRDLHDACRMSGTAWFAKQDSGPRAGQRGRIPDDLWVHEYPAVRERGGGR